MVACEHCGANFEPKNSRGRFCSAKCRKADWQQGRRDALAVVEEQLTRALTRVRVLRGGERTCR